MKEILLAILLPQLFILPLLLALRSAKKDNGGETKPDENKKEPDEEGRVFEILRRVYLELNRQHAASRGPWISSALAHKCGDPAIALNAVRFTIRDLQQFPIGDGVEYVKGLNFMARLNMNPLRKAEEELLEMMGAGE